MTLSPSRSFNRGFDNHARAAKCPPNFLICRALFALCFVMLFGGSLFVYLTIGQSSRLAFDLDLVNLDFSPSASHFSKQWLHAQARSQANYHPGISSFAIESVDPFSTSTGVNVWDLYPPQVSCPDIQRLGKMGEGGKWICGMSHLALEEKCVMYSFGVSTDISFEAEVLRRTSCDIHAFDPTIGQLPFHNLASALTDEQRSRIRLHKVAMGVSSGTSTVHSLNEQLHDIMHRLKHSFVNVLKVDIEGGEWGVFERLFQTSLPVGQLLIELHYSSMREAEAFFVGASNHGFLPFSREINLQPCIAGGQPLATEYSFIHADLFYNQHQGLVPSATTPSWHRPIKAVIYLLSQRVRTRRLSSALQSLYENFWRDFPHYPVVIFHEDLRPADEKTIQRAVPYMKLRFVRLTFTVPQMPSGVLIPERTPCAPATSTLGYRHMCRFHSSQVHTYLSKLGYTEYEYVMRLDDDSLITAPVGYDLFRYMRENGKKYAFTNMVEDDPVCVQNLWESSERFYNDTVIPARQGQRQGQVQGQEQAQGQRQGQAQAQAHNESLFMRWPRGVVFYNNLEISHLSVWKDPLWLEYMQHVDELGGIYTLRWGDAPLHTIGVTMLLNKRQIHSFSDIGYKHEPFIDQTPKGLPMPHMDPFVAMECSYYDKWVCQEALGGNLTYNSTSLNVSNPHTATVRYTPFLKERDSKGSKERQSIERESIESTPLGSRHSLRGPTPMDRADVSKAVFFSFGYGGRESTIATTLNSLYEQYLSLHPTPVVIFYSEGGTFDPNQVSLHPRLRALASFQGVRLRSSANHQRRQSCSSDSAEMRDSSLFFRYEAIRQLKLAGYRWTLRFADDSKFRTTVRFNIFQRLQGAGRRLGYIGVLEDRPECADDIWELARSLCASAASSSSSSASSSYASCGQLSSWPRRKVYHNFEASHVSVWDSPQCLRLLAATGDLEQGGSNSTLTIASTLWADSVIHTVCAIMALKVDEMAQMDDVQYRFNWSALSSIGHSKDQTAQYAVRRVEAYDQVFSAQRMGWLGADVAASVALPNALALAASASSGSSPASVSTSGSQADKLLWLFGDSLVGVSTPERRVKEFSTLVSNSVGVTTLDQGEGRGTEGGIGEGGGKGSGGGGVGASAAVERTVTSARYYWSMDSAGTPSALFKVPPGRGGAECAKDRQKLWPLGGFTAIISPEIPTGGADTMQSMVKLFVLADVVCAQEDEPLRFKDFGGLLLVVENPYDPPDMWEYRHKYFPSLPTGRVKWMAISGAGGGRFAKAGEELVLIGGQQHASQMADGGTDQGQQVVGRVSARALYDLRLEEVRFVTAAEVAGAGVGAGTPAGAGAGVGAGTVGAVGTVGAPFAAFSPLVSEASLHYDPRGQQWLSVSLHFLEKHVQVCATPQQALFSPLPWNCSYVAPVEQRWQLMTYAAKAHPDMLTTPSTPTPLTPQHPPTPLTPQGTHVGPLDVIVSYVSNTLGHPEVLYDADYRSVYTPKFIRISS